MSRSIFPADRHWRRSLLLLLLSGLFSVLAHAQDKGHYYLLISGYTKAGPDQGIAVYDFDSHTGALKYLSVGSGIYNPSFLAVSKDGSTVYAVSEKDKGGGSISAWHFDKASRQLHLLHEASSGGRGPCYISVDDAGTHVFAANYGSGSIEAVRIGKDGALDTTASQVIQHEGGSIDKESQRGPHAHSALPSPDGRYLLSANLGNDRVYVYRFDPQAAAPLQPAEPAYVNITPGSGPRHICFHPNGSYVYVVNEMAGSIDAFGYKDGVMDHKQTITMLPEGFKGTIEAADIHISPDGRFLYASNREVRNELVIYAIGADGMLTFVQRQSVLGAAPRNFAIDPTGKFLLVANLKTNEVVIFRRDAGTGLLTFTGKKITAPSPACLKFVDAGH